MFYIFTRRSPRALFGCLSPAKHLVWFKPRTFRFWSHRLNPQDHSPRRANSVKVNISRNSIECLHMIFVSFFPATTLQYKQLKIEFYFSNESYNEEQQIGSIILPTSSFSQSGSWKKLYWVCFINFFDFIIYISLVILNYNQLMGTHFLL